jgi:hypothetical protein
MINDPKTPQDTEETLVQLCRRVIPMMIANKEPEEIEQALVASGMSREVAQPATKIVVVAALAALEIRRGKSRAAAIEDMGLDIETRAVAERLLDVAIEEVAKHPFDTVASNPGGVDLELMPFLKSNLSVMGCLGIPTLIIMGGFGAVGYFVWKPAFAFVGLAVAAFLWLSHRLWTTTKIKFKHGCANPAIVVSTDPCLIAVMGNLANNRSGDTYNVIKIVSADLSSSNFDGFRVGGRVATVALYSDGGLDGRWADFDPEPVNCATTDRAAIDRVLKSFSNDDWKELDEGLAQVPDKTKPGLHPITLQKNAAGSKA